MIADDSRDLLGLVDEHLLVGLVGLLVVNHALVPSGRLTPGLQRVQATGVNLAQLPWLFVAALLRSTRVSNVPAVMRLLMIATQPLAGPALALASTFAGNLFLAGSLATLIVIEPAAKANVRRSWREHAGVAMRVTLLMLALAAGWLWRWR